MREPIIKFNNKAELMTSLREWQRILFLEDWVIDADLVDHSEIEDEEGPNVGHCQFYIVEKAAHIRIAEPWDTEGDIIKPCAELVLVHELLHCKRAWLNPPETAEGKFWDTLHHQALEEEARSYLLAKYPEIDKHWFVNHPNG